MRWKLGVALVCSVAATSCVLTVDDVVLPSESVLDPALLGGWMGAWEGDSATARAVVSDADGRTYLIDYTAEDGRVGSFQARLGRLGGHMVLEVWPAGDGGETPVQADLAVPGHMLFFLDTIADDLHLSALDPDPVERALEQGALRLPSRTMEGRTILLGETDALRESLEPFVARGDLLADVGMWRRVSDMLPGAAARPSPADVPCFESAAWRDADLLFHRDPHWVGADVASTVDLGDGRILWLFGDTWIDPSGRGTRSGARMVSNSVAIQTGPDPSTASISFFWGRAADGTPAAFVPDRASERLWFGNGVRVDDRLVLFMSRIIATPTGLGFESVGWTAFLVENPDADPSAWRVRAIETPTNPLGIDVGFAAVSRLDGYVYAFGAPSPIKSHPIYAARWPAEDVRRGNLARPEWWAGERIGWIPDSSNVQRWPLFENGQSELTIHRDRATKQFLAVHTQGFGPADVMLRAAPALTGPWTAPRMLYRPPEYYGPDIMIYAGKAHPALTGADLVLTYATNSFDFGRMASDSLLYYPRFVRLTRCR
jgi:hypothetical protein